MRKLFALLTVLLLLACVIPMEASAASTANKVDIVGTVTAEGDCLMVMNVVLRIEGSYDRLTFPLPLDAKSITMNGGSVSANKNVSATHVDISRMVQNYQGDLNLRFEYTIPDAVKVVDMLDASGKPTGKRQLELQLPLLSGFEFPVERMSFIINMPTGNMPNRPNFTSTYRQTSFGSDLEVLPITSNQIVGSSKVTLNDHEEVLMTLVVPKEMFPTVSTYVREGNPEVTPMLICAGLALVYWLLFLRTLPIFPTKTSTPPEGITAGELGCRLTLCGGDLTTMVFSWAELGYLLISLDGNGRVLLHKRMDMGNERNAFENKIYKNLFGSRRVVDATGNQYAALCDRVQGMVPSARNMHKDSSGSKKIYRGLCAGSMVFCGICVAMNMSKLLVLQILLSVILSVVGAVSGWLILGMAYRTHLRGKTPVFIGFGCMALWILLGLLCGQVWIPLIAVFAELLLGYLAAYGGRRSELGRHDAAQVLGLRRYLKKLSKEEIARLQANDPDYYFHLAPHALALGIIDRYSRNFGQRKLSQCPYIVTQVTGKRTAEEWGILMASIADKMDAKQRRMQVERWIPLDIQITPVTKKRRPQNRRK